MFIRPLPNKTEKKETDFYFFCKIGFWFCLKHTFIKNAEKLCLANVSHCVILDWLRIEFQ